MSKNSMTPSRPVMLTEGPLWEAMVKGTAQASDGQLTENQLKGAKVRKQGDRVTLYYFGTVIASAIAASETEVREVVFHGLN